MAYLATKPPVLVRQTHQMRAEGVLDAQRHRQGAAVARLREPHAEILLGHEHAAPKLAAEAHERASERAWGELSSAWGKLSSARVPLYGPEFASATSHAPKLLVMVVCQQPISYARGGRPKGGDL